MEDVFWASVRTLVTVKKTWRKRAIQLKASRK